MRSLVWWGYFVFMTVMLMLPHELLPAWLRGGGTSLDWIGPKDKILHAGSFACLMLAWVWSRGNGVRLPVVEGFWSFVYGVATELVQGVTGWRDAEWMDLVADSVGILIGGLLAYWLSIGKRPNSDE